MYPLQKRLVVQTAFLVTLLAGASFSIGSKASVHDEEHFFETKVRPLLVAKCYECHSEEISEAGLRLDSYQSVLKGSDAGIVVTPGDIDASKIIEMWDNTEVAVDLDENAGISEVCVCLLSLRSERAYR